MGIGNPKKILVAPLDWGLGHTTRCVPLIRHLQSGGHLVTVAGNASQLQYLTQTFPGISTLLLEGYNISYGSSRRGFIWSILRQVPHIINSIRREHRWLLKLQKEYGFDGIISDNRYGLYHPEVSSVIMTHQLQIQTGIGWLGDMLLRKMHYRYLGRFSECWIVDVPDSQNLSGKLAHPDVLPANGRYLGLLSQLHQQPSSRAPHLLILLSGPEPQRTILSSILWQQALAYIGRIVFVEGADGISHRTDIPGHISYYTRVTRETLEPLLTNAHTVICRSGYSTLMDVSCFGKKAILIPTPGQTEQEYLARYLQQEQIYFSMPQKDFDLGIALERAETFPFLKLDLAADYFIHKQVLDRWTTGL